MGNGLLWTLRGVNLKSRNQTLPTWLPLRLWVTPHFIYRATSSGLLSVKTSWGDLASTWRPDEYRKTFFFNTKRKRWQVVGEVINDWKSELADLEESIGEANWSGTARLSGISVRLETIRLRRFFSALKKKRLISCNQEILSSGWQPDQFGTKFRSGYMYSRYVRGLRVHCLSVALLMQEEFTTCKLKRWRPNVTCFPFFLGFYAIRGFLTGLFGIQYRRNAGTNSGAAFWLFFVRLWWFYGGGQFYSWCDASRWF